MSRSYKKNPIITNSGTYWRRFAKNYSNRIVRRFNGETGDGGWYKKLWDTWNICDFKYHWFPEDEPKWPFWKARMK